VVELWWNRWPPSVQPSKNLYVWCPFIPVLCLLPPSPLCWTRSVCGLSCCCVPLITSVQSVLSLPQPGLVFVCYRLRISFIRRRGCRAVRGQICDVSLLIKLQKYTSLVTIVSAIFWSLSYYTV